jgi:hypothetical protein
MRYSQDFFKQRSFEVVWAVFRVAEKTTRQQVKALLEEKALAYLADKNLASLEGLEEVVRLGAHIGEINDANAKVLQREINNLRLACNELMAVESRQLASKTEEESAATVEEIFSQAPMVAEDLPKLMGSLPVKAERSFPQAAMSGNEENNQNKGPAMEPQKADEMAIRFRENFKAIREEKPSVADASSVQEVDSVQGGHADPSYENPGNGEEAFTVSESGNGQNEQAEPESGNGESGNEPAMDRAEKPRQTIGFAETLVNTENSDRLFDFYRRRKVIIELLEQKPMCHIKDVMAALPHVSERTLRYDIKSLVDKGVIERAGGGGPHSFLRIKRGA